MLALKVPSISSRIYGNITPQTSQIKWTVYRGTYPVSKYIIYFFEAPPVSVLSPVVFTGNKTRRKKKKTEQ